MKNAVHVQLRSIPAYHVACMRYTGVFGPGVSEVWQKLAAWAEKYGLWVGDRVAIGRALDDAAMTPGEEMRYEACLVVPKAFKPDAAVRMEDLPACRAAVRDFQGTQQEIGAAWKEFYTRDLPASGMQAIGMPFERYFGEAMVGGGAGLFKCELCVPIG